MKAVFITRDSLDYGVEVWPELVGIRKFYGCVEYGAAWDSTSATRYLFSKGLQTSKMVDRIECRERYGFYPRPGEAWHVSSRGKRTKVDIDFTN